MQLYVLCFSFSFPFFKIEKGKFSFQISLYDFLFVVLHELSLLPLKMCDCIGMIMFNVSYLIM